MDLELLAGLNAERNARRAALLVTDMTGGPGRLVRESDDFSADPLANDFREAFRSGRSKRIETAEANVFITACLPPPRLVMIGAVHISQALSPVARIAGFDVTIVDPRTAFATEDRFAGIPLHADWPETVLPTLAIDRYTALAALTHDPKIDDFALQHALEKDCFYVGALGSRKTHAKRQERLEAAGVSAEAFARIHAPIGLAIGAVSPSEIAVSIMAEIIATLRRSAP
ncbi:putative xanthine dehydrogenase subunit A [Hartmannibacter diazotrophicus]|uniref:Putative xanthine dehydrogenase subunit A n=1 Tax=Hartmannibacter diazotrophicus TaxID=1482074 RepID=A0A2C9DDK8_9HYPH|nr:XdhC family protein [Hartmannibacter diazotrophicus]SON58394.1 putative xanthine dehydrogenase subunit A [Hartmannibacter diazotrophicus]